mgnify:CR=1 FL=1
MIKNIFRYLLILASGYVLYIINAYLIAFIYIKLNPTYHGEKIMFPFWFLALLLVGIELVIYYKIRGKIENISRMPEGKISNFTAKILKYSTIIIFWFLLFIINCGGIIFICIKLNPACIKSGFPFGILALVLTSIELIAYYKIVSNKTRRC